MKKILQVCLPISLGLLSQFAMAQSHTLAPTSFGHGNDNIHITNIHTSGADAHATLYLGTKLGPWCIRMKPVGKISGFFVDGMRIGAPSELFDGQKLNDKSCAVEEFIMDDTNKKVKIHYQLINDGTQVTGADPAESDVTFPN